MMQRRISGAVVSTATETISTNNDHHNLVGNGYSSAKAATPSTNGVGVGGGGYTSGASESSRVRKVRTKKKRKKMKSLSSSLDAMFDDALVRVALVGVLLFVVSIYTVYHIVVSSLSSTGGGGVPGTDDVIVGETKLRKSKLMTKVRTYAKNDGSGGGGFISRLTNFRYRTPPYKIPNFMEGVGDKSVRYALLRKEYDELLPSDDVERMKSFVRTLRKHSYQPIQTSEEIGYDIFNCPLFPPDDYPKQWHTMDLLNNWGPDDTTPQTKIYQGLCVFDHHTEHEKAVNYREAEVPFIIRDDPAVLQTVERWNTPQYMHKLLGKIPHRTEYSPNNHFMYWMAPNAKREKKRREMGLPERKHKLGGKRIPPDWKPPTQLIRMSYPEWLEHANVTDDTQLGPDKPHWYFRLIGCGGMGDCDRGSSEYLFDELTFFQPKESLYIVLPDAQKGIHCRFGMKGVVAENHFDGSRNMIALLGGERRYILSHPNQCENLALYPKDHPSGRHSAVDWADPDLETYPQFKDAMSNEVVLQAGDVMYLPTNWFHYIVSLELNYQCNTRSGISEHYMDPIHKCGF